MIATSRSHFLLGSFSDWRHRRLRGASAILECGRLSRRAPLSSIVQVGKSLSTQQKAHCQEQKVMRLAWAEKVK